MSGLAASTLLSLFGCLPFSADPSGPLNQTVTADDPVRIDEYELELQLSFFAELEERSVAGGGQTKRSWSGTLEGVPLAVKLIVLPANFGLLDALEVVELLEQNQDPGWTFQVSEALEGKYGWTPVGWFAAHREGDAVDRVVVAGVLREQAYFVELSPLEPSADKTFLEAARAFADEGVRYTGEQIRQKAGKAGG